MENKETVFQTSTAVEDADAAVSAVVDLVVAKDWIALGLYPDASHRVVKDLVVFDDAKAAVVHKDSAVLAAPYLVAPHQRVASGSA